MVIVTLFYAENKGFDAGNIASLLDNFLAERHIDCYGIWYYTPMAVEYTSHLVPQFTVYDSMDELSKFRFAPPQLKELEEELFRIADVVFTGGHSLYEAKKHRHHNIHPFPSSIDKEHFQQARTITDEPEDQRRIPHPRLGFYGVIDERLDSQLISEAAYKRPDWHFVLIGPVVKISEKELPKAPNIHYLGQKSYQDLPIYAAGWDIALIPFAMNESTEFISPTKTPEYLAAGLPVISTPIQDVVNPYGRNRLVHIAEGADELIAAAEFELKNNKREEWVHKVDEFLRGSSWDDTFQKMSELIDNI
ncbi:glycosyltransferase [Cruoricaptor ignavus]|uniref:glycosyltransferase n=1 Tax=Cruoricaptor ignavus TaxID=1118202 RepID=UPI00370D854D